MNKLSYIIRTSLLLCAFFSVCRVHAGVLDHPGISYYKQIISDLIMLGDTTSIEQRTDSYLRMRLTPETVIEMQQSGDSTYVVYTVCAPRCSSCARVYIYKEKEPQTLVPTVSSALPLATFVDGKLVWTDNEEKDQ